MKTKAKFRIKREDVAPLLYKYETYPKEYILTEDEHIMFNNAEKLSDWERVVYYAMIEFRTVREVAKYFHTTQYQAYSAMKEINEIIKNFNNK